MGDEIYCLFKFKTEEEAYYELYKTKTSSFLND